MLTKIAFLVLLTTTAFLPVTAKAQLYNEDKSFNYDSYGKDFYIGTNGLRIRSTPEDAGKVMGLMNINDVVRVVSPELINGKFVEVQIVKSSAKLLPADHYYVVQEYLTEKPVDYKEFTGKNFVVINVATETLRVYERQCMDNSCPHKMIMETEVVVGEDKDLKAAEKGKGRSLLGSYRISGWAKFYEDSEGHYPAWYKDGYPAVPKAGDNNWKDWFDKDVMPLGADGKKGEGKMRGAFGWYTAFVSPNPFGQWLHGTIGWGSNKDEYIAKTKKFMINVVSDPRSSGCTRNNNEAIAFIRHLTETGTPVIKVYAREAIMDPTYSNYREGAKNWDYIFTKKAGLKADRADVLKALGLTSAEVDAYWSTVRAGGTMIIDPKSNLNQILEVGTYTLNTVPTTIEFQERKKILGKWRDTKRTGNVYGLKKEEMSPGVYYVDAGMLSGYYHPTVKMEVSGFMDEVTPEWMNTYKLRR